MKPNNDGPETELKKLQRLWYKKLKDKGFQDIEHNEFKLRSYHSYDFNREEKIRLVQDVPGYYRDAEHFLNSHQFKNKLHKFIWKNHSEAISLRNTVKLLKLKNIKMTVWAVNSILKKIKVEFTLYRRVKENET